MIWAVVGDDNEVRGTIDKPVGPVRYYVRTIELLSKSQSVFRTADGLIGLGPYTMQDGDCVVILPGVSVPYIARPIGSDLYTILGDAYVPSVMYGELFEGWRVLEPIWMEFC